jgi:predicted MFS family arabinose efflux permease
MGSVILTWLIFARTHSTLAVTALGVVGFLPTLTVGVFAGALIDRYDRRRLMILADVGRAVATGALAVYVAWFGFDLLLVLAVVFAVAALSSVFRPASNALLPSLLDRGDIQGGNGLLQAGTTVAMFAGSPLGGVVLIVAGAALGLIYNAATFAISAALLAAMALPAWRAMSPSSGPTAPSLLSNVRDGFRFLLGQTGLLTITLASMAANFFTAWIFAYIVVFAAVVLHAGPAAFGILLGFETLGFGIGSLLAGPLRTERAPGTWFGLGWFLSGICLFGLVWFPTVPVDAALLLGSGLFGGIGNTTWLSGAQRTVPDEYLGRYFATDEAGSFAMIPAGTVAGGLLILALGVSTTFVLAAIGILAANLFLLVHPAVRAWGRVQGKSGVVASDDPRS